ncbi:MAG: DNA-binding protein [Hadesarchaea archaeon]|nr:MAG: DNA-binding protein [Hadesarchaea archaeon]
MEEETELEEIRRRKLLELQAQLQEQQRREEMRRELELQKKLILQQILTPEARSRLTNLKMVKPEFAESLELELIALAQAGRLRGPITDAQLKELLRRLQERRREIRIRRV